MRPVRVSRRHSRKEATAIRNYCTNHCPSLGVFKKRSICAFPSNRIRRQNKAKTQKQSKTTLSDNCHYIREFAISGCSFERPYERNRSAAILHLLFLDYPYNLLQ